MVKVKKHLFLILTFLLLNFSAFGQTKFDRRWGIPDQPQNCEQGLNDVDNAITIMQEEPNANGVFILIARLGNGETRSELNHRRLFNVSDRFINHRGVSSEKIVTAVGNRVNGLGRVEIYWKSKMIGALLVNKNKDICVSCCPPDEDHYPDRSRALRKRKNGI